MNSYRLFKIAIFLAFGLPIVFWALFYFSQKEGAVDEAISGKEISVPQKLISEDINKLEQRTALKEGVYVEDKSIPVPTNQWYSSAAFTKTSEPMFAYPLAVKMNNDGFGISYPKVVSTADTVFASYDPDMSVVFQEKTMDAFIQSYDDLSVEVSQKQGANALVTTRITHGSPYIFASVAPNKSFTLSVRDFSVLEEGSDFILFTSGGKVFAFFFSPNEVSIQKQNGQGINVSVSDKGAHFSVAVLPNRESLSVFKEFAFDPIVSTRVAFDIEGENAKSRYEIVTKNKGEPLFALLPKDSSSFDSNSQERQSIGEYQTIRGKQSLYRGNTFSFSRKIKTPLLQLELTSLSEEEKESLRNSVKDDVNNISITEGDTYFLGKKLFALANVLDIAEQLGMETESAALKAKLRTELEQWKNNSLSRGQKKKYFYYDPIVKGIVGEAASFGSEVFNDHHFHYGYFIYAASILSRYDKEYLAGNSDFINLLVKDIANTDRNDKTFSYLRGFDAYEGHSWASGQELFADGNNQESSSEAVNAWYALYLWSDVIGNKQLRETALYLYSEESASALRDWLNIDRNDSRFENFKHTFISLLWGGKSDAATWFSPRPEAKLGIQIIPVSPASLYLGQDMQRARENILSEQELQNPTMFKDYLAMYEAIYDVNSAKRKIDALKREDIDGANSRSFMEAWVAMIKKQKN